MYGGWTYQLLVRMRPRPFESWENQTGGMKVEGASGAERPLVDRDIAEVEAADGLADGGATDGACQIPLFALLTLWTAVIACESIMLVCYKA